MPVPTELEILRTLRKELFDEGILKDGDSLGTDDETLFRFLRARKFNIKLSKKMITDCQAWRQTVEGVGIDELYRQIDPFDYPGREAVFDCWPMWFHKTDKKGRPLNVHFFGGMNLPELYNHISPARHWQSVLVNAECLTREILPASAKQAGKPIGQVLVIVDLKGFGLSQFWQMKSLARESFQISQDYYPETMGQLAIVNAPSTFTFIWGIMKPWLSKETAEKVDILGSDYRDVLLRLVDKENLPSVLGGACTCAGEEGGRCELSGVGPWRNGRVGWGPNSGGQGQEINSESGQESAYVNGDRDVEGSRGDEDVNGPAKDEDHESRIREGNSEKDMDNVKKDQSPGGQESLGEESEEPHIDLTSRIIQDRVVDE